MQPVTNDQQKGWRLGVKWDRDLQIVLAFLLAVGIMIPLSVLVFASIQLTTDYGQCEDNAGTCWYINGMDAAFFEGEIIPQRMSISGNISANHVHTVTWSVSWNNKDQHGYDFTASYTQAQQVHPFYSGHNLAINQCAKGTGPATGKSSDSDMTCWNLVHGTHWRIAVDIPDDNFESASYTGWPDTDARIAAFESRWGNRTMDLWANAPITSAHIVLQHTLADSNFTPIVDGGDYGGGVNDSLVRYALVYESDATAIMIEYGTHFALTGNPYVDPLAWGYKGGAIGGLGAAGLYPSGMWHVKDQGFWDPSANYNIGSQDNQSRVGTPYLYPMESMPSNFGDPTINVSTTDRVTMTTKENSPITGTISFYLCSDTTYPYTNTVLNSLGCTGTVGTSGFGVRYVGAVSVTEIANPKGAYAVSPYFTPTLNGQYCFLTFFTPTIGTTGTVMYGPSADTNYPNECFLISTTTPVGLSSFRAFSGNDPLSLGGFSIPLLLLGLVGIAGGIGVWKFGFHGN